MANQNDSFIDEVTEDLRRDRLFAAMSRYGWLLIAAILLLVYGGLIAATVWDIRKTPTGLVPQLVAAGQRVTRLAVRVASHTPWVAGAVVLPTRTITAGTGLSGGGTLAVAAALYVALVRVDRPEPFRRALWAGLIAHVAGLAVGLAMAFADTLHARKRT